ncbi:MAG: GNAT family N-acetyltransferase [Rhodocyclaceae bacterium]|nr:GNAT family N-acetyltransferase [Rhodocyclaceae bacterium]
MPTQASQRNLPDTAGCLDTDSLLLKWAEAPWDTAVFGFPVLQIDRMQVRGPAAGDDMASFEKTRDKLRSQLVSCRLSHEQLRESMLLEDHGFRFIEMIYQPELDDLDKLLGYYETGLSVWPANEQDLPDLMDIAGSAFHNERFHVDPRLDSRLGDQRYRNWVANCLKHPSQRLYAIRDGGCLVAFFVTERLPDGTCFWHLNAVAPGVQGKGYGRRAWLTMLHQARSSGAQRVRTSIVARNHRALNLYAQLGFRFPPPLMTFHWVRAP